MTIDVMFIHGMYLNGQSWQPWVERFTSAGFSCTAPSWPYHDGGPRALRSDVDPRLGRLTFGAVSEHLKGLIDALPERPVLVGHSIGGLLVQRLVNDGYASPGSRNRGSRNRGDGRGGATRLNARRSPRPAGRRRAGSAPRS